MSLLREIRNQPERTRKAMFIFAAVITISVAGMIWVNKLQRDLFVLLNPDLEDQRAFMEAQTEAQPKPFAFIKKGIEKMQAIISGLFRQASPEFESHQETINSPQLLPLPKSR